MGASVPTQSEPLLVVILGPTGSGKSALAIALAQQFAGEVVSCDSVSVYRHFEIGTAKPTLQQRALVPHHLLDVAEPGQPFTAGEYARQARAAIAEIAGRQRRPIVVGGTGLYLRALLEGLFPGPQRSEPETKRMQSPLLYDLTELQRHANRLYSFSAQQTLDLAQALYERHKLISYPRTDSRHLSADVASTVSGIISAVSKRYEKQLRAPPRP